MSLDCLSRRTLLDSAIRVAALPAGMAFFSAWTKAAQQHEHASGSQAPPVTSDLGSYQPQFFTPEDFEAIQSFTEILIPTDETPGAREAHCAHFIDFVLQASAEHAPNTRQQWPQAMRALEAAGFHAADAARRLALVEEISRPERDRGASHPAYFAYRMIKQQ